jgi:hypothetical protein
MVDNSFKRPTHYSVNNFTNNRANDFQQNMSKGLPCHITKIGPETDMVTVAFDTKGSWAMPTRKMPVAFSPYGRDALTVGDKGYASPADYYLGGISGLGGGVADYTPRANLTPLTFHPISKTTNEKRDNDQYVMTGGKNGVKIIQAQQKKTQQQGQQSQTGQSGQTAQSGGAQQSLARRARVTRYRPGVGFTAALPEQLDTSSSGATPSGSTSSSQQGQQDQQGATAGTNMATMEIDKNGKISHKSPNGQMSITVDQQQNKVTVNPSQGGIAYLGGDGTQGMFMPVLTIYGPCINTWGKVG